MSAMHPAKPSTLGLVVVVSTMAASVEAARSTAALPATTIAPHRASYELSLKDNEGDIADAEGRIAFSVEEKNCEAYALDYRFVARFQQDQEMIVTDQWTKSTESTDGQRLLFETRTFVDTQPQSETQGTAATRDGRTTIALSMPEEKRIDIPAAMFPMAHTIALIDKAKAGQRIVEQPIFDGDSDAEKKLTSTAIIAAVTAHAGAPANGPDTAKGASGTQTAKAKPQAKPQSKLKGLRSWRVSESFYNSDSDADGQPVFQTAYTLYENGVSDDLVLTFDGYSLAGGLASLDLLERSKCT